MNLFDRLLKKKQIAPINVYNTNTQGNSFYVNTDSLSLENQNVTNVINSQIKRAVNTKVLSPHFEAFYVMYNDNNIINTMIGNIITDVSTTVTTLTKDDKTFPISDIFLPLGINIENLVENFLLHFLVFGNSFSIFNKEKQTLKNINPSFINSSSYIAHKNKIAYFRYTDSSSFTHEYRESEIENLLHIKNKSLKYEYFGDSLLDNISGEFKLIETSYNIDNKLLTSLPLAYYTLLLNDNFDLNNPSDKANYDAMIKSLDKIKNDKSDEPKIPIFAGVKNIHSNELQLKGSLGLEYKHDIVTNIALRLKYYPHLLFFKKSNSFNKGEQETYIQMYKEQCIIPLQKKIQTFINFILEQYKLEGYSFELTEYNADTKIDKLKVVDQMKDVYTPEEIKEYVDDDISTNIAQKALDNNGIDKLVQNSFSTQFFDKITNYFQDLKKKVAENEDIFKELQISNKDKYEYIVSLLKKNNLPTLLSSVSVSDFLNFYKTVTKISKKEVVNDIGNLTKSNYLLDNKNSIIIGKNVTDYQKDRVFQFFSQSFDDKTIEDIASIILASTFSIKMFDTLFDSYYKSRLDFIISNEVYNIYNNSYIEASKVITQDLEKKNNEIFVLVRQESKAKDKRPGHLSLVGSMVRTDQSFYEIDIKNNWKGEPPGFLPNCQCWSKLSLIKENEFITNAN